MVSGAESFHDDGEHIRLKEMVLQKNHPWIGQRIQELEISRQSIIVLVRRNKRVLIPNGNMISVEADTVHYLYPDPCDGRDGDQAVNHWTFSPFPHIIERLYYFQI